MWRFCNLNTDITQWPPDTVQHQNSANPVEQSFSVNPSIQFPGFGAHGSFLHLSSSLYPPLNPAIGPSGQEAITPTKRFLVFDQSGDQTSLVFSSVANPFEGLNPCPPAGNTTYAYASNSRGIEEEEMHEDTEEIDALLYSDSEYIDVEDVSTGHSPFDMDEDIALLYSDSEYPDDEEVSTGHSPFDMDEDIASPHFPGKRRRVDSIELDESLMDTAGSAFAPRPNYIQQNDFDLSFMPGGRSRSNCNKLERIQQTVSLLRRITPGGKGKDTASVLDEAIQYLKSLKLQAKSLGGTASLL